MVLWAEPLVSVVLGNVFAFPVSALICLTGEDASRTAFAAEYEPTADFEAEVAASYVTGEGWLLAAPALGLR